MRFEDGQIKLSGKERAAFFAGDWPSLGGEGKPPAIPKDLQTRLSSRLSFVTVTVHRLRRGREKGWDWELQYRVIDDREERFHLTPAAAFFETDETGNLLDMPPEEEIGYTRNPKKKTIDELPSVPPDVQKVIDTRARLERVQTERSEDPEGQAVADLQNVNRELRELVKRATKMGMDPLVAIAPVAAEIRRQHGELSGGVDEAA